MTNCSSSHCSTTHSLNGFGLNLESIPVGMKMTHSSGSQQTGRPIRGANHGNFFRQRLRVQNLRQLVVDNFNS